MKIKYGRLFIFIPTKSKQHVHRNNMHLLTLAILGFSNGGFPRGPSIVGLLIFNIHFLSS